MGEFRRDFELRRRDVWPKVDGWCARPGPTDPVDDAAYILRTARNK